MSSPLNDFTKIWRLILALNYCCFQHKMEGGETNKYSLLQTSGVDRQVEIMFPFPLRRRRSAEEAPPSTLQRPASRENLERLVTELITTFTCLICTSLIATTSIFACSNEHIVCENCFPRLPRCPTCRQQWRGRSRFAENIRTLLIENARIPCPNHLIGCTETFFLPDLEQHLQECSSQWVTCPAAFRGNCDWKGPFSNLMRHCRTKDCARLLHQAGPGYHKFSLNFASGDHERYNFLMPNPYSEGSFVVLYFLQQPHDFVLFAKVLGANISDSSLKVSIRLAHPVDGHDTFTFSGNVHSKNATLEDIKCSGQHLTLTRKQLFLLYDASGTLYFNVHLYCQRNAGRRR